MSLPKKKESTNIEAYAIDADTARTAFASDVDNHYLFRYGSLFASSFIEGFCKALGQQGTTTTDPSCSQIQTKPELSPQDQVKTALGTVGEKWGKQVEPLFKTPATITVDQGLVVGVLFMRDADVSVNPATQPMAISPPASLISGTTTPNTNNTNLLDVFARGQPTSVLQHRIASMLQHFPDPHRMPTFIDNHDVDRWLANGNEAGMKLAMLAVMTLPGIPTIYYGTEQGFRQPRAAMFASGYQSQGRDHFDTQSPLFAFLREVIALRKQHRALSQGNPDVILADASAPGALAWLVQHGDVQMLVLFNTAEHPILTPPLPLGTQAARLRGVYGLFGQPKDRIHAAGQSLALPLAARDGQVYVIEPMSSAASAVANDTAPTSQIDALPESLGPTRHAVSGHVAPDSRWQLLLDGRLDQAIAQ